MNALHIMEANNHPLVHLVVCLGMLPMAKASYDCSDQRL